MPTEADLELLKKNLQCEFEEIVGKSPLGTLYRIQHHVYGACALKYVESALIDTHQILQSLSAELEKIKRIHYPKFGRIYEVSHHPVPLILREWIPGENLQDRIQNTPFSLKEATQIMLDVAWGMQAAYNFGSRHKNLKPNNIIIKEDFSATIVDALLPPSAPRYISPEHCNGKNTDIKSDIYSAGIIYYQAITGSPPFTGGANKIMRQHLEAEPPAIASLPPYIDRVLKRTMAKTPEERYEHPLQLIEDLQRVLLNLAGTTSPNGKREIISVLPSEENPKINTDGKTMAICIEDGDQENIPMSRDIANDMTMDLGTDMEEIDDLQDKNVQIADSIYDFTLGEEKEEAKTELDGLEILEIDDSIPIQPDRENLPKELPETLQRTLLLATDVKQLKMNGEVLTSLNISSSIKWKELILSYLLAVLRRECWVVKEVENSEEIEIVVDVEMAKTLRYFNYFDDCIQKALSELPELSSIHKSIITHMQSTDESSSKPIDAEKVSINASYAKLSSIISMLDTIPGAENNALESDEAPIELEELEDQAKTLDLVVNFNNPYQTRAWFKLVKEYNWETGKHFQVKEQEKKHEKKKLKDMCFSINLLELQEYNRKQAGMSSIKEFFQGDYEISRLDQGGMAAVLKLSTKNDSNIILLRAENQWARKKFAPYLCVRKGESGKEFVYADVPKGTEFVVKVAFEGREEELIYEARLLSSLAQEPEIAKHVIGVIQQGSFLATGVAQETTTHEQKAKEEVGYYLMLEYASLGNLEQFSRRFPDNRLSPSIALSIMYGMVKTLQYLKAKGIIHRDIKPHNILLDANGVSKLSDFGLAITVEAGSQLNEERRRLLRLVDKEFLQITTEKEQTEVRLKRLRDKLETLEYPPAQKEVEKISYQIVEFYGQIQNLIRDERERAEGLKTRYRPMSAEEIALKGEFAGSLYYAAPEQFSPSKVLTYSCDVYQLGAVCYRMLTGKPPVKGKNISQVMGQIILGQRPKVTDIISRGPLVNAMSEIIYQMMENDPEQRIAIEKVQEKLDEIFHEYSLEIETEPNYEQAGKWKNNQELLDSRQKIKYARQFQMQILPSLTEIIEQAEKKAQVWKGSKKNLKTMHIAIPVDRDTSNIRFRCPHCNRKLQLPNTKVGKKIRCPSCEQKLVVKLKEA